MPKNVPKIIMTSEKVVEFASAVENDRSICKVKFISVREGANRNGAIWTAEKINQKYKQLINKPLGVRATEDFYPTNHAYNKDTNRVETDNIGTITASELQTDAEGKLLIVNEAILWKYKYPEIVGTMKKLHDLNSLKFSVEAGVYKYQDNEDGTKIPVDFDFEGVAVVDEPAEPKAKSLWLNSLETHMKGDKIEMDFEKILASLPKEQSEVIRTEIASRITDATKDSTTVAKELASANIEKANLEIKVEELEGKVQTYETEKETAEKERLTEERKNELTGLNFEYAGEKELVELSELEYAKVLIEASKSYAGSSKEEKVDDVKITETASFNAKLDKQKYVEFDMSKLIG